MKVSDIADALGGEVVGDGSLEIKNVTHPMNLKTRQIWH